LRVVPATVVLPTIGRPELIRTCLESLGDCLPRAAEIVVVDSSENDAVARVVDDFSGIGARVVRCATPGLGHAFNLGLREARHEHSLLTNDDCTVDRSWVERGLLHITQHPEAITTGRVKPDGDPKVVPSTIDDPAPREYHGRAAFVLYTQCAAVRCRDILDFGGFDGRIRPSAEDNDLAYRWLRAGRSIRYEPDFVVWHHDWRTRPQLERLYVGYGVGQGMVYGKHLRRGDLAIARYVLRDVGAIARGLVARVLLGRREAADPRLGLARGLPIGLARGWRAGGQPDLRA
jgi:GT2 family glycosyltransferase